MSKTGTGEREVLILNIDVREVRRDNGLPVSRRRDNGLPVRRQPAIGGSRGLCGRATLLSPAARTASEPAR